VSRIAAHSRERSSILAFGEETSDTRALAEIARSLRPDLPHIECRKKPIILGKNAHTKKRRSAAEEIVALIAASTARGCQVNAVILHRDLDNTERDETVTSFSKDGSGELAEIISADMRAACASGGISVKIIAAVPAYEIEAWWFLWPEAVAKHRPGWDKLQDRTGQRVDMIVDAKKSLQRALRRPDNKKIPEYSESDGLHIVRHAVKLGILKAPKGVAVSYMRYVQDIESLLK